MKNRILPILAFLLLAIGSLQGQTQLLEKDKSLPCINREFTIMAHIVRDTMGGLGANETNIQEAVDILNEWYAPICVSFNLERVEIVENFQYSTPANFNEWQQMWINHNHQNRINLYVIADVRRLAGECVHADHEGILDLVGSGVAIERECLLNEPIQIVHAFGHYCGLFNTNENPGAELVDGSNCATEGDLICDTPADPFDPSDLLMPVETFVNENCQFIHPGLDANGEYYVPQTGNAMSNYPSQCWCGFTQDQFMKMAELIQQSEMW